MIKSEEDNVTEKKTKKEDKKNKSKLIEVEKENQEEIEEIDSTSEYYKVGDAIDCTDNAIGAWFEAKILRIFTKSEKLFYKVKWDLPDTKDDEPFDVQENSIRPRAWKIINFNNLEIGQKVMLNYNLEHPKEVGNWYDFTISTIKNSRAVKELIGTLHIGDGSRSVEDCSINTKLDIFRIENPILLSKRDEDLMVRRIPKTRRKIPFKCSTCQDNSNKRCRECSCKICGKKDDPHLTLLCDECDTAYHIGCLKPPLTELPSDDDWYCPDCKVNSNEIVKVGEKINPKKKHSNVVGSNRDWGKGMACVGRTKICTIVPLSHRGPIPGIEVGTLWKFRFQVSEAGVHRPHVAGIHGKSTDCAYSIVLSGGYEDDLDNGEEFFYTGSGGRDLSGNKRTAKQSSDQQLTLMNRALALNCNAKMNEKEGAEATDWKAGIPIRVVRNFKLSKHSKYAPEDGNRYDGIYKVVKYWPEKGQSGFRVWRYLLRRDDPIPAPWTKKGIKRIADLGLEMIYPEGYQEAQEKKSGVTKKRKSDDEDDDNSEEITSATKKRKIVFKLNNELLELIEQDLVNIKLWNKCNEFISEGKQAYYEQISTEFACIVCQDLVCKPVTTPCAHNICISCLKRSFEVSKYACPMCRSPLDKNDKIEVNEILSSILLLLFPGYDSTR